MTTIYQQMIHQLDAILENETNIIANLANASALINQSLEDINWVGFYLYDSTKNELILGPFQGKVACIHIPLNSGVCGVSAYTRKPQCIKNVHDFKGHIACDSASNAEIVIPIIIDDVLIGVLDIDSPTIGRFSNEDLDSLLLFVEVLKKHLK